MQYQDWKRYENPERWTSYFTQIDRVLSFHPKRVLEVGVGNHIVTHALKQQGLEVTTLDIDAGLAPDLTGSVEKIPSADQSFDVVLCAEVLEHLPYERFETCLSELKRVSRQGAVLSLPHWGYTKRLILDIPGLPKIRHAWKFPFSKGKDAGSPHEWEINRTGYPLSRIKNDIEKHFTIVESFLSPWMPYHHFFVLKPKR